MKNNNYADLTNLGVKNMVEFAWYFI